MKIMPPGLEREQPSDNPDLQPTHSSTSMSSKTQDLAEALHQLIRNATTPITNASTSGYTGSIAKIFWSNEWKDRRLLDMDSLDLFLSTSNADRRSKIADH